MNKSYTKKEREHFDKIKSLCCIVCGQESPSAAHHIKQRSAYYCIPLCHDCHQGKGGIHGDKTLWKIFKLDEIDALALTIKKLVA